MQLALIVATEDFGRSGTTMLVRKSDLLCGLLIVSSTAVSCIRLAFLPSRLCGAARTGKELEARDYRATTAIVQDTRYN